MTLIAGHFSSIVCVVFSLSSSSFPSIHPSIHPPTCTALFFIIIFFFSLPHTHTHNTQNIATRIPKKMKAALLLSALASCAIGLVAAAAEDFKIEVTHPVECDRKTQKGDKLSMHYRGTLAKTGDKFDASAFLLFPFPLSSHFSHTPMTVLLFF